MKKDSIRFTAKVLSLALATGITLSSPINCYAETNYKNGTFIEYSIENEEVKYNQYVVKNGDNLSHISEKICKFFGEKITTKYWPVIAFINEFPKILRPGDIVVFPKSFDEMVSMYNNLKEIGWISRYLQSNNVYDKRNYIIDLLHEIYGDNVRIDDEFVSTYLKTVGLYDKYITYSGDFSYDEIFELTGWIPTIEQLQKNKANKSK